MTTLKHLATVRYPLELSRPLPVGQTTYQISGNTPALLWSPRLDSSLPPPFLPPYRIKSSRHPYEVSRYCGRLTRVKIVYSSSLVSAATISDAPACLAAARREYHASSCFLVIFLRSSLGKERRSDHARSSDSKMVRACEWKDGWMGKGHVVCVRDGGAGNGGAGHAERSHPGAKQFLKHYKLYA